MVVDVKEYDNHCQEYGSQKSSFRVSITTSLSNDELGHLLKVLSYFFKI